jgi:REP element-mobilizing transposase RayT
MGRQQQELPLKKWGGKRKGAGRPRIHEHPGLVGPGVPHLRRAEFKARHPLLVTLRFQPGVGDLRAKHRANAIESALGAARERGRARIVHYSIQGNHLHLIMEAKSARALGRAMQGLTIRIARALNALTGRRGGVFADRYHARALVSPREVASAVRPGRRAMRR